MALPITITDAGRAEIINAQNTGTGPVTITEIGFGTGQYGPAKTQTSLQAEVKRVSTIAGEAVAADTIHVVAKDEGADAYNVGEFGLYSASGTLLAVYSQVAASGWIIQKAGASTLLLAVDIVLESLDATSLTFGDVTFINPPATTTTPGVVQLEDSLASTSTSKALTAKQGKVLQDGKQPLDATLTALAALVTAADKLIYATGPDAFATTPLSAFMRTLLDDANATAAMATLGAAPLASPAFTGTPTAPTPAQATNNTQLATTAFVKAAIAALVDSSPGALDTLNELAAALGDDPNFATTMTNALAAKQPLDATLTALAALVTAADKMIYSTGSDQFATATLTAKARTLLASMDEAAMRVFLGLVKQTSAGDETAGAVLLNGAHGLGSTSLSDIADLDAITSTSLQRYGTSTLGKPAFNYGTVLSIVRSAAEQTQFAVSTNSANAAFRYRVGGVHSSWFELWHASNLVKQTSIMDGTTGRVLLAGAFNLGRGTFENATEDSASLASRRGYGCHFRRMGPSNADSPLAAYAATLLMPESTSGATAVLALAHSGSPEGYIGTVPAAGGSPTWAKLWTTGNLTPAELSPPGAVAHFARNSAPSGWLKANGAAVSRTTYAALFAAIGTTFGAGDGTTTFNLPDLRGEFVRGWDDGRGVDSGRAFGSAQADELKSHSHSFSVYSVDATGPNAADSDGTGLVKTASTAATGGSETRPRNIALLACIKY